MKEERFRPVRADVRGDQMDKAEHDLNMSLKSSGRLSPGHSGMLPSIKTPKSGESQDSGKYLSRTDYNSHMPIEALPQHRSPLRSSPGSMRGSQTFSTFPSLDQSTTSSLMSRRTDYRAGDWKKDRSLRDWMKTLKKRNQDEVSKKLRAANKEAQWILERRELQMKQHQRRQKAEAEAERRMNAKKESVKNQRAETASTGMRSENGEEITTENSSRFKQRTLRWKVVCNDPVRVSKPQPVETSIWVKPGRMCLKYLVE
uniref:Uncharacterized protein n=1 Tax=Pyramimonas obovata TaxID=1411642 RepID=A0A6T7XS41_9CHLO|mmetsp:Transcript_37357/g.81373  ORF Transcript_37357/g.81373 Transcript_37357/m.81373 type:complete len:258 (+) Transcript_37357:288-1061(+)|eukprot:CAMPEP_0118928888 /NCGR_PEP_ID=MMETSP1169-20130426/6036_1 /TAXON_ID=36882 /ORGANISM="Pyramimonas obovata, Strain CCMP722" /LENGTH=257 /DNA_ID=CAMNT_0006870971 /DNA_START=285 /DNA_END=1058 /DNA_ORIENTATION=-